ncbi:hypothetical protein KR009_007490 [Drosophila setifemur]|nr:hypothetical protein KR009_007490 [Drosophila setifemur]
MFAFMDSINRPPLENNQKSYMPIRETSLITNIESHLALPEFASDVNKALEVEGFNYCKYNDQANKLNENLTAVLMRLATAKDNLKLVAKFREGKEYTSLVQISQDVFKRVSLPTVNKVILQVGTGLQMEFGLKEAEEFIRKEITSLVEEQLKHEHDIDFLQDQVNAAEINLFTLYNHGFEMEMGVDLAECFSYTSSPSP